VSSAIQKGPGPGNSPKPEGLSSAESYLEGVVSLLISEVKIGVIAYFSYGIDEFRLRQHWLDGEKWF
jgi:hypothetical protein